MSTYWNLYCITCDDECGALHLNHGDDALLAMLDIAPLLAPLAEPDKYPAVWDLQLLINCQQVPLEWVWAHQGHRLGVRSEYGEVKEHGERKVGGIDGSRAQSSGDCRAPDGAGQQPAELGDRTAGLPAVHP